MLSDVVAFSRTGVFVSFATDSDFLLSAADKRTSEGIYFENRLMFDKL